MAGMGSLDTHEYALTLDLMEALVSSLDLSEVLTKAYGVLSRRLSADYAAICVSKPGTMMEYDWVVAQMPSEFFSHHGEMASGDFVRQAVAGSPSLVMRDTEMVPREELERGLLYQRYRELGMPLEHVMAVLLDMGHDGHGGFMLYRDRLHPFSDSERALLQRLTPLLTSTVRNCRMMGEAKGGRWMLEQLLRKQGCEFVVLAPPATEFMRTDGATKLLESWFPPAERGRHGLPTALVERLGRLSDDRHLLETGQDVLKVDGKDRDLYVTFIPVSLPSNGRLWALMLKEVTHVVQVPTKWSNKLTKREKEVVACVLGGWDNLTIAEHLGCAEDTVKRHLFHVYNKLGVSDRKRLLHMATQP
jgi:DNA-binding CsgD family transcriptional regulator